MQQTSNAAKSTTRNILIGGGTGFIGKHLIQALQAKNPNYNIFVVSRSKPAEAAKHLIGTGNSSKVQCIEWDDLAKNETIRNTRFHWCVNLTGHNIMTGKWSNPEFKAKIMSSRIEPTKRLLEFMAMQQTKFCGNNKNNSEKNTNEIDQAVSDNACKFVGTSATGFYPTVTSAKLQKQSVYTEDDMKFSISSSSSPNKISASNYNQVTNLVEAIESAIFNDEYSNNLQKFVVRPSVVLGTNDGALANMAVPFMTGFFPFYPGTGDQMMPVVHIDDLVNLYIYILENVNDNVQQQKSFNSRVQDSIINVNSEQNSSAGNSADHDEASIVAAEKRRSMCTFNATLPTPISFYTFSSTWQSVINKQNKQLLPFKLPFLFRVPQGMLELFAGREAGILLCEGAAIVPKRALDHGFKFQYGNIEQALDQVTRNMTWYDSVKLALGLSKM